MIFNGQTYRHFKHFAIVLFLQFAMLQTNIAQVSDDSPLIHSGKMSLLDGNFEQSIVKFSEHLKVFGFSSEAYYWRAHCLLQMGEIEKAVIDLKLVLDKDPNDSRAMDAMGYANNQLGQYYKAIQWFNKAIAKDNNNALIYNNRGMSYYYLEKFSTAFKDFDKAIQIDSTFAQAYSNRGSARYNRQNIAAATKLDLQQADADYTKAIELDNLLVSAYRNRGIIRYNLEQYRESFLDFQKAIYLNPNDPLIYFHMGNLMFAKEEYTQAASYYTQAINRKDNLTEALYKRAETYEILQDYALARYDYEVLIEQDARETGKCFYHIAKTYALEKDSEHARYYLNQARKNDYFKSTVNQKQVFKEAAFLPYWEKEDFIKLRSKIEG